ncbi:MAG TPA: glycosyltransferase [bacterium]|nr:glycosyltransferase [bacterium]
MDHQLFRANLNILHQVYPDLAKKLETFEYGASKRFAITPHPDRGWTCIDREENPEHAIHGPQDPWAQVENYLLNIDLIEPELILIYRCGLGYMPQLIYPQMRSGRHAQRLLITEDRWEVLASSFWLLDWTDILRSDRVIFLHSEESAQSIMQFFVTNPIGMLPVLTLMPGCNMSETDRKVFAALQERMGQLGKEIRVQTEGFLHELKGHYATRRESIQSETPEPPAKILFVEPEHEYLAKNMIESLREMGFRSDMYTGNMRMLHFVNTWLWLVYTAEHHPDILLWMNRNSLSPIGKRFLDDLPVTKAIWYLDNPERVKVSIEELEATDMVFSFDHSYLPLLREMGSESVHTLHNAAGLLPAVRLDENPLPRNGPEAGFVGALAANRFIPVRRFWLERDSEYVTILDGIVDDYLADPSKTLAYRYKNSAAIERLPYSGFPVLYLEERATYLRRLRFLQAIKDMELKTYGAPEWASPEYAKDLVPCYAGKAPDYHRDLPQLYYDTKININIFHVQCIDSPNPRVFDVLACGGFLITEYRPSLEECFQDGVELRWFRTKEELAELVAYYREHPDEREEIARRGQEKALAHHLAKNRMETMMNILWPERKK